MNSTEKADISVVNRKLFESKSLDNIAKVGDLVRVHDDVIGLEEATNRNLRSVNRKIGQIDTRLRDTQADINAGFDTFAKRIDTLGEGVTRLDDRFEGFKGEYEARENLQFDDLERSRRSPPRFPPPPPPFALENGIPNEAQRTPPRQMNFEDDDEIESRHDSVEELEVNILTEAANHGPNLTAFNGETAAAFEEWMIKFMDFVQVYGVNWNQFERINRLKLYLGTQSRNILENLTPGEKDTLESALKNIRDKLDSPHFKELAYKKLAMCLQRENESISEFIKRLVPLVNATSTHNSPEAKEETLCRCFIEKVRPEFRKSLQLVGPLIGRKDFDKLTAYVQELEVIRENDMRNDQLSVFALGNQPNQFPQGRFNTWNKTNPNTVPINQNRNWGNRNNQQGRFNLGYRDNRFGGQGTSSRQNWGPQNDRKWNSRPFCQFCRRTGHDQYNCRERQQNNYGNFRGRQQWNKNNTDKQLKEMVENLAIQVHEIKMGKNNASATQQNIKSLQPMIQTQTVEPKTESPVKSENLPKKISSWEKGSGSLKNNPLLWTTLSLITLISLSVTSALNPVLIPERPMICQTQRQPMVWELPDMPLCPKISLGAKSAPISQDRQIFIPNSIEFSAKAWTCRKIRKNAQKYTTLFNVPHEQKLEPESLDLTIQECKQMIEHKSCSLGNLKKQDGLWQTQNKIDLNPRFWFMGSFNWKKVSSENCFLFKSRVDSHFGAPSIVTPLGEPQNCPYEKGQCILPDKTVLIWEVNDKENALLFQ